MNELVQILKNTRQHLMTGVSHMIPFIPKALSEPGNFEFSFSGLKSAVSG